MIVVMRMIPRCIRVLILFLNLAFFLIPCTYCDNTSRYDGSNSTSPIIASGLSDLDNAWFDSGNRLFQEGEYDSAIKRYDEAIKNNPNSAYFWMLKGEALISLGKYNEAIECFDKVLAINSSFDNIVYANKALALLELDRLDESSMYIDKALETNPQSSLFWGIKSIILLKKDNLNESLIAINKSLYINSSSAPFWLLKGVILAGLNNYDGSIECCNESIIRDPTFAPGWLLKGIALSNFDRFNESYECCDKATELDPLSAPAWAFKGMILAVLEDYAQSSECYNKSISLDPSFKALELEAALFPKLTIKSVDGASTTELYINTICVHVCHLTCDQVCTSTGINWCEVTKQYENTLVSCVESCVQINEEICTEISIKITREIIDDIIVEVIEIVRIRIFQYITSISISVTSWSFIL